ncbi:MAG: C39 family peptidase [Gammaproteobacteria bacterium]
MTSRILAAAWTAALCALLAGCGGAESGTALDNGQAGPLAAPPELLAVNRAGAPNVGIANFVLTGTTRISRTVFDYTYTADATNSDTIAVALTASVSSSAISTTVMDGALNFGNVAPGATKTSLDTFTIRQDRTVAFDANSLSWTAATTRASAAGLMLEEVMYAPVSGAVPFIDVVNAGADSVPLQSLILDVSDVPIRLLDAATELTPGARLHILLDGESRVDGLTYHASAEVVVSPDSGHVALRDRFSQPLDQVAWGAAPGAVNVSSGGVVAPLVPGSSIGRPPGATDANDPQAWVAYTASDVTPAAANLPAPVRGMHPLNGAIELRSGALLSWFPVPGATGYGVQVAADAGFSSLVLDVETADPRVDISGLAAGSYAWRVQSEFAGNSRASFSTAYELWLNDEPVVVAALAVGRTRTLSARPAAAVPTGRFLPVPLIEQHKDSRMLLLEESHPGSQPPNVMVIPRWDPRLTHLWDVDHVALAEDDPADNMNCVLASLTMMNHFFSGDLKQDRIGYQVFRNQAPGPEYDLNLSGLDNNQIATAYAFALGKNSTYHAAGNKESLWTTVTALIDSGVPVLAATPEHAFVIVGYYALSSGTRYLAVNDPWHARRPDYSLDPILGTSSVETWEYWTANAPFSAVMQEASVTTDSDGDKVYDFDETQRFHTNPNDQDTDHDGVHDYEDIYASEFDLVHGYAHGGLGRDYDHDYLAMELDPDSDGGGCKDGQEDKDGNGLFAVTAETWNFDAQDDTGCAGLAGHLTQHYHFSGWNIDNTIFGSSDDTTVIAARLAPDPANPGDWIDAGSTFSFRGAHEGTYVLGECELHANSTGSQSGDFTGPSAGLVQANIVPDGSGRLSVHYVAGIDGDNTEGWLSGCSLSGHGKAGDSYDAVFPDDCWGEPVPGAPPGQQTYSFSCQNAVSTASGSLTVVVPPPP